MSHTYTVCSALRASAIGAHRAEDHGVPWQNTAGGPSPHVPHRTCPSPTSKTSVNIPAASQRPGPTHGSSGGHRLGDGGRLVGHVGTAAGQRERPDDRTGQAEQTDHEA